MCYDRFFFVSLYARDIKQDVFSSFLGKIDHFATINNIDGCLQSCLSPSIYNFREIKKDTIPTKKKRKRRCKRGMHGPECTTIRSVDLHKEFLTIYFTDHISPILNKLHQYDNHVVVPSLIGIPVSKGENNLKTLN